MIGQLGLRSFWVLLCFFGKLTVRYGSVRREPHPPHPANREKMRAFSAADGWPIIFYSGSVTAAAMIATVRGGLSDWTVGRFPVFLQRDEKGVREDLCDEKIGA